MKPIITACRFLMYFILILSFWLFFSSSALNINFWPFFFLSYAIKSRTFSLLIVLNKGNTLFEKYLWSLHNIERAQLCSWVFLGPHQSYFARLKWDWSLFLFADGSCFLCICPFRYFQYHIGITYLAGLDISFEINLCTVHWLSLIRLHNIMFECKCLRTK